MDYKKNYEDSYNRTIKRIEKKLIDYVISSKQRKKNFNKISNTIREFLCKKEQEWKDYSSTMYPELVKAYNNRFNEYEDNYLENFFLYDFSNASSEYGSDFKIVAAHLGIVEAFSKASSNYSNSWRYFETAYALNKNYDKFILDFSYHENHPLKSKIFEEMQKERFPETTVKATAVHEDSSGQEDNIPLKSESKTENNLNPIEIELKAIDPEIKLFIIRQLYFLPKPILEYFSLPEFIKLLKLLDLALDTKIFSEKPSDVTIYRTISKGLTYYKNHATRERIKSDTIGYLKFYGFNKFKDYIALHSK